MTGVAVLLVALSAFAHASWNMLAKRSSQPEVFNWLMAASSAVLTLPVAIALLIIDPPPSIGWAFIGGTIGLHIVYFFALGRAYKHGDLSIVYPVARGLGLMLIPVFGVTILSEEVSPTAAVGIAVIFAGVVAVGLSTGESPGLRVSPRAVLKDRGVQFALLTGVVIGLYSTLDKRGVDHVTPVLYMFFLTAGGSSGMLALIARQYSRRQFVDEFRSHWKAAITGGGFQFGAYVLVLSAFRLSPVSYVGPFRELAVAVGVLMGALVLKERVTLGRAAGAASVTAGAVVIALAP